jgi:hypothetical protein
MGDWIGLGIILLVVIGALAGLSYLGKPPKPLSREEYERRVAESRGFMSAGVMASLYALQKLLNPKVVEAIEVQRDLKAGFYNHEEKKGEGDIEDGHGLCPVDEDFNAKDEEGD